MYNKSRILLLLKHKENRNQLLTYLDEFKDKYEVVASNDAKLFEDVFDLIIVDGYSLDTYFEKIKIKKKSESPLFLPILFVTNLKDLKIVTRHLWSTIDEMIFTPIRKIELLARVEILLRTRRLSMESEERYHALTEASPAWVLILQNNKIVYANSRFLSILDNNKLENINFFDLVCSEHKSILKDYLKQISTGAKSGSVEVKICWDLGERWFSLMASNVVYRENPSLLIVMWDITERIALEDSLRNSEKELRIRNEIARMFLIYPDNSVYKHTLHIILRYLSSGMGVFGYIDEKGNYVCYSVTEDVRYNDKIDNNNLVFPRESWQKILGRTLLNRDVFCSNEPFEVPDSHVTVSNVLGVPILYGKKLVGNMVVANKEGGYLKEDIELLKIICDYIAPILNARLEAETERKNKKLLEEQFIQAQKMEAIGRLTAGVAHDFNNILGVILGYGEILLNQIEQEDPKRNKIEEIVKAGERASTLTRQLLAFSRKRPMEPQRVNLNVLINKLKNMLKMIIGVDVTLELSLADDLDDIFVDPGQIEQVILNLAVNAKDAMPKGGKLIIETKNVKLDEYSSKHLGLKPGEYVLMSIADTGKGIPSDVIDKIFEPFFTTKEKGKGTGLGLSTVYKIVTQWGGKIDVCSEIGKGTIFRIYLPKIEGSVRHKPKDIKKWFFAKEPKRILVVEDDDLVRKMIEELLSYTGYEVVSVEDGIEALNLVKERGEKFDLLLTDLIMPHMDGNKVADILKEYCPDIKVIYMSGYSPDALDYLGLFNGKHKFLQKPFTIYELSELLHKLLFT